MASIYESAVLLVKAWGIRRREIERGKPLKRRREWSQ
jgi:hypothetical protein